MGSFSSTGCQAVSFVKHFVLVIYKKIYWVWLELTKCRGKKMSLSVCELVGHEAEGQFQERDKFLIYQEQFCVFLLGYGCHWTIHDFADVLS
jgi:hypothetical protein